MIKFSISDTADQKFATTLNGQRVSIRLRYNVSNDRWSFDLSLDGDAVLHGRKIVPDVDLIAPFGLGIGVIFAQSDTVTEAGRNSLIDGTVALYHATQEEVDAAVS